MGGGEGDHAGVVSAQVRRCKDGKQPFLLAACEEFLAQALVATDTAADGDELVPMFAGGQDRLVDERIDDGFLHAGTQVGERSFDL